MKIIHVYAQNLKIFEDALDGTGCRINGARDMRFLQKSFSNFNARDVMGLIVFRRYMTKKTLRMIQAFDELFVFAPVPIIIVCDDATALCKSKKVKTKYAPLFAVDSVDGTISDIDINKMLTTLCCFSNEMFDMSGVRVTRRADEIIISHVGESQVGAELLATEVLEELSVLERGV